MTSSAIATMTTTAVDEDSVNMSPASGESANSARLSLTATGKETPFCSINKPFQEARTESEEKNRSFQKGDTSVEKFNTAITGFLTIFDALGSPVITEIVRRDFRGKTNGLKNSARRLRAETLRELVQKEHKSPPRFWAASGIDSLLWAHRILRFVEQIVSNLVENLNLELKDACIRAYRSTLAVRHPHMTRVVFEKALLLVPPKNTFFANLTKHQTVTDDDHELCLIGMKEFLRSTRPQIEALTTLFDLEEVEDPHR